MYWGSLQRSFVSVCNRRERPSCRSRARIVAWHLIRPRARVTDECQRRCASDGFAREALTLPATRHRTEKHKRMFGGSRRRGGRSKSIEPVILAPRRLTSRVVWSKHSTPSLTERPHDQSGYPETLVHT